MSLEKKNDKQKKNAEEKKREEEAPIHGDILDLILSHVPLIDLIPASHVSKSWNLAVFSSLRKAIKPWLIVYSQRARPPYAVSAAALAYDPRSSAWIEIEPRSPVPHVSLLRSSNSTLLYTLSPSRFSFSVDPLHLTWRHVDAPHVWRTDPIVVVVGKRVVLAGGASEFEDDGLAVEMLDVETGEWETCESMPAMLKDSAASTWLSAAANGEKMYVTEKRSGVTYSFDPESKRWIGPFDPRPDGFDGEDLYSREIGFIRGCLIMVGITGGEENPTAVKVWEVSGDSSERFKLIGSMPRACLDELKLEDGFSTSIAMNAVGDTLYIRNPAGAAAVVICEMVDGMLCNWQCVANVAADERSLVAERLVFACSTVTLGDLDRALKDEKCWFSNRGCF